jgi:hypothetical protein
MTQEQSQRARLIKGSSFNFEATDYSNLAQDLTFNSTRRELEWPTG